MKTVAENWGPDIANRLAMWAIDAMLEPPTTIATHTTAIPAKLVAKGRAILDDAGFDWRAFKREHHNDAGASYARRKGET